MAEIVCSLRAFLLMRLLPVSAGLFRSAAFGGLKACKSTKNFTVSRWMTLFFHVITGIKHNFRLFFPTFFYYMWGGYPACIAFLWTLNIYWIFVNFLHLSCLFLFSCLMLRYVFGRLFSCWFKLVIRLCFYLILQTF